MKMNKILISFLSFAISTHAVNAQNLEKNLIEDKNTEIVVPGEIGFKHPAGEKGWFKIGLDVNNDGVYDLRKKYGLRFQIKPDKELPLCVKCILKRETLKGRKNMLEHSEANIQICGNNWQTVTLPFQMFDYNKGQDIFLRYIKNIIFKFEYADKSTGNIELRNVHLVDAEGFLLETDIYSKPLDNKLEAYYTIKIKNLTKNAQSYGVNIVKNGWEGMKASVSHESLFLQPGEMANIKVEVKGNAYLPQGAHEQQTFVVTPLLNNERSQKIELITVVPVQSPFLVHNEQGWKEVKEKIEKYAWAKSEFEEYVQTAEKFVVPQIKKGTMADQGTEGLVRAYIEKPLFQTAVAWKLTGNRLYGEKVAELLRQVSDPEIGYPRTQHLTLQGIPQEGGTFEGLIHSYDLIKDSGLLTTDECLQIEHTFRLFCNNMIQMLIGDGAISNWTLFNIAPAAQAALLLHDMDLFNKLMYGPCGVIDQFRYGTMDDGWWYEVSLSYNLGAALCFTQLILATRPFGIDLQNIKYPSSLTRNIGLRPFEYENFLGMSFGKSGPLRNNSIDFKRLWDGILIYPDYRGIMFGMGDGHEELVAGNHLEVAYYIYRDPRYASIIKQGTKRNLIYGVPELPEDTPRLYAQSGHSDNAGIAVLRSQTDGREPREQIQAAVKYGTHGSYHGHFDRASLLSLMRYGRSFWNPETSWYGYGSYMYKWWVQPSMAHNMVVVDGKMQEPTDSENRLFYTGKMMQATLVETKSRWSNPPYMGGYEQIEAVKSGDAPYVVVPEQHPAVGAITDYTEPILQRRLLMVTDDYVLINDYLKADKEHTFDNLFHLKGVEAPINLEKTENHPFFDDNPLGSGQFIANIQDYRAGSGAIIHSSMIAKEGTNWSSGGFNGFQEPGVLNIDLYYAWPYNATLRLGTYPEALPVRKKLTYEVQVDNRTMTQGSIGTWIKGSKNIQVPVKGAKNLVLLTRTDRKKQMNTLFWANVVLVNSKGEEIPVSLNKVDVQNIIPVPIVNKDYKGDRVVISGKEYPLSLAAEPDDIKQAGTITINLEGLDAVEFKATVGGDFPVGDESQVRKTLSYRSQGKEARFLTVLEPYEGRKLIKKVMAIDPHTIEVELSDGRTQIIKMDGLDSANGEGKVSITEFKQEKQIRSESTDCKLSF